MENIIPHHHSITKEDRVKLHGYKPLLIWFTGFSGSGKSTLANALEVYLDGDNIRTGLNKDLDFSEGSRTENIRRISEVSNLFLDAGVIVLTAFISPFKSDRQAARDLVGEDNFVEVYVECPLEVCEQRDVKGLYAKARRGEIPNFTGISSPFEEPEHPSVKVNTSENELDICLKQLINKILPKLK